MCSGCVEPVEPLGGGYPSFFSRTYLSALYRQVNNAGYFRLVTIGDLKSCNTIVKDRVLMDWGRFRRVFLKASRELRDRGCLPEVYATVMWFNVPDPSVELRWSDVKEGRYPGVKPIAYDFIIDIDAKDNPWLEDDNGLGILADFAEFIRARLGLEPGILIAKGVQLRVSLLNIHAEYYSRLGDAWPSFIMDKLPLIHRQLALRLAREFRDRSGVDVRIDEQVYDSARVTRLDLSLHSGIKAYAIPFKPSMLRGLSWSDVKARQTNLKYVMAIAKRHTGLWGSVANPTTYSNIIGFHLALSGFRFEPPKLTKAAEEFRPSGGWRTIVDPILGEITYSPILEGFNWVRVLVRGRIPIRDGRNTAAWLMLPVAVAGPKARDGKVEALVAREEAVEWLKACLEAYPDPEKVLDDYVKKFEYNLKYGEKYNMPTWRHLIEEVDAEGKPISGGYRHLKYPVIEALAKAGYIRLSQEQEEKLRQILGQAK